MPDLPILAAPRRFPAAGVRNGSLIHLQVQDDVYLPGGGVAMQKDELLTIDQVLGELSVARRTFTRWRALDRAPQCLRLPNGELRIWRSEFNRWLRARVESRSA